MNLIALAEAGDTAGVLAALGALTPPERAARAGELAARTQAMVAGGDLWQYSAERRTAQSIAELGCQVTAEAAADWLLKDRPWPVPCDEAAAVTRWYPPGWRAELVERLAQRVRPYYPHDQLVRLALQIVADTGGPVPTTDEFISAWLADRCCHGPHPQIPGASGLDRLRVDHLTPLLLPLAVARPGVRLIDFEVEAFLAFAAEGLIDRDALIRHVYADLASSLPQLDRAAGLVKALRLTPAEHAAVTDDRVRLVERLLEVISTNFMQRQTIPALTLLRALAPTPAENARFAGEYLARLRADWWSPDAAVGAYAQQALVQADEAGLLAPQTFAAVAERAPGQLGPNDYVVAAVVSRLSVGKAIDRGALIERVFAHLAGPAPHPGEAAYLLSALALTPAEHAGVAGDRVRLVEPLLAGLLTEDGREATATSLAYLSALAPTATENARFTAQYIALLDRPSTVAGHAQEALLAVDKAGLLEAETFSEMGRRVLLRPEKKLVRAQLAGIDDAARADPARAPRLTADAATAFQHPDPALQERALEVTARHLPAAGDPARPGLRAAAEWLSPALSARAAELLGPPEQPPERYTEVLPAVPVPRTVPGPVATAAEVAQEVAAVVAGDQDVAAFERALDGLVRHARRDRATLAAALRPALRREPTPSFDCQLADLYDVAQAVRGEAPRDYAVLTGARTSTAAGAMLTARMAEAADIIEAGTQPFLLAVPTCATGALDAHVLVERLAELEGLGVPAAPVDFAQALLRVAPAGDTGAARAAGELRSAAGQRLARWLRDGGLPHRDSEPEGWYRNKAWYGGSARPEMALDPAFPPAAAALLSPERDKIGLNGPPAPFWVAQLPHHRDELMASDFRPLYAYSYSGKGITRILPFVAEADGPAGYAVHRALAYGMAHSAHGDEATVDALLVLAARGQLDTGLLGRLLETLLRSGAVEANRVAGSLRAAAETGAYGTAWAVLEATLPGLLEDTPVKSAAVFLALAADCVSRCGATGEIAEVTAVAGRGGSSLTVKNARLLRDALHAARLPAGRACRQAQGLDWPRGVSGTRSG
jgi:hypothetical protein